MERTFGWLMSLLAHDVPLAVPTCSEQLDHEAELAVVVVGRRGCNIPRDRALEWTGLIQGPQERV
ncbi:fumarylacetoacetate hydrolase family protein [Archangium violaceum]|uniref:fumarylacetoacetate hydrolase family protein n=1 Tax=Archangium violaceum TaxID=83451 RepID=UPI001EF011F2|nr:fumarylacetoacetate hydrolase family protein [Archangium violaceum]